MRRLTVMLLVSDLRHQGGEGQLLDLARGIDKSRFRVLLAMLSTGGMWEHGLGDVRGVELRVLDTRGKWDPGTPLRLASLLRTEEVDVLQALAPGTTVPGMAAAMIARTPVKVLAERMSEQSRGVGGFLERRLARFADVIVTESEAGARALIARGVKHERLHVIYDGVSPGRVGTHRAERNRVRDELGVSDDSWLIGLAADLTEQTDHGTFLQAASIVRAEVPGTKFLVVGEGPLRSELARRAAVLGLNGSLIMAGYQQRHAPYIGAMDVAVLPPGNAEASADFGLAAMGLGRPIVATDIGANSELFEFGEVGLVVPPGNPIILAHAILEVMRHPDAVERMRARGRKTFSERFTLERMVSEHEALYRDLWRRREARRARGEAEPVSS